MDRLFQHQKRAPSHAQHGHGHQPEPIVSGGREL
jgi:HAE1 family hydrophobic/amphiphilic exporter-1